MMTTVTLTPKEVMTLEMGIARIIEDMEEVNNDQSIPFTPEARKDMRDILTNAKAAKAKLELIRGHEIRIAPYVDGDEKEFLTKES